MTPSPRSHEMPPIETQIKCIRFGSLGSLLRAPLCFADVPRCLRKLWASGFLSTNKKGMYCSTPIFAYHELLPLFPIQKCKLSTLAESRSDSQNLDMDDLIAIPPWTMAGSLTRPGAHLDLVPWIQLYGRFTKAPSNSPPANHTPSWRGHSS